MHLKTLKRKRKSDIETPSKRAKRDPKPNVSVGENEENLTNPELHLQNSDDINHDLESTQQNTPIQNELKNDSVGK